VRKEQALKCSRECNWRGGRGGRGDQQGWGQGALVVVNCYRIRFQRGALAAAALSARPSSSAPLPAQHAASSCRLGHVDGQVHKAVGVAHLVVVPAKQVCARGEGRWGDRAGGGREDKVNQC